MHRKISEHIYLNNNYLDTIVEQYKLNRLRCADYIHTYVASVASV